MELHAWPKALAMKEEAARASAQRAWFHLYGILNTSERGRASRTALFKSVRLPPCLRCCAAELESKFPAEERKPGETGMVESSST